jgi:hypothetical protein
MVERGRYPGLLYLVSALRQTIIGKLMTNRPVAE